MGRYAALAIDAGARIVGGCCGNTPAHVAAMRLALDEYQRGPRPDLAAIEAALGKLVSPPASGAAGAVDAAGKAHEQRPHHVPALRAGRPRTQANGSIIS